MKGIKQTSFPCYNSTKNPIPKLIPGCSLSYLKPSFAIPVFNMLFSRNCKLM